MATTVYVKNVGSQTDDKEIKDFFSFCGKIASIDITTEGSLKSATVTFEKETAARTALLLNHTQLGGNEITVTGDNISTPPHESSGGVADTSETDRDSVLTQEEKPRSRILAEVLAHGYLVADQGLQKAIALDEQHNITSRFVGTLRQLDERTHATDRAQAAYASYGNYVIPPANSLLTGLGSYFEKASNTPTGKRIVDFYTTSQRQVQDIHTEARRLAELKKEETGGSLYKGLGLDKVLGRFQQGGAERAAAAAEGSEKKDVPGGAPADAVATENAQKPVAPSGTGNPETIH
ncbi:hypothetical protein CHGG_08879 [Chaetomium globosum CBS 148.51]|uniref:RRM domain-containing protein n=1 Tax=Chaetomium globosum (strain ATCC 6205 / CBS 148.51 / DSM 1962 / NBRC 6347 / NRRL 1970) TaxID=306901 RepID=Q2GT25_CHAGB|nr:uncharacterized protein CHGG_08879 [Chaetomium globosum CBS 148.51]EAQ84865.1 hypothetical protein CHGG_08879 [Chaetomium globosum CBS 148.51]